MKLALATLVFAAPAFAFVPSGSFGVQTALKMSTETSKEKVRESPSSFEICMCVCLIDACGPFESFVPDHKDGRKDLPSNMKSALFRL